MQVEKAGNEHQHIWPALVNFTMDECSMVAQSLMVKHRLPLRIWAEPGYRITTLSRRSVFMLMANLVKEVDYGF